MRSRTAPRDRSSYYDRLLAVQNGRCGLCGAPEPPEGFVVDHDHQTRLVRGLLCFGCNVRESRAINAPDVLEYRRKPPALDLGLLYEPGDRRPMRHSTPEELHDAMLRVLEQED